MFGSTLSWIYVKDQTQSPIFTYQLTGASFVQQANDYGAQGAAYLSDLVTSDSTSCAISPRRFVRVQNKHKNKSDVY